MTVELARKLARAYNPRNSKGWDQPGYSAADRQRWLAVAQATNTMPDEREAAAAHLHAVYIRGIYEQMQHGWPPRSERERDRWLAVADAAKES